MRKLKEADWIALRLLYIMMASDPSVVNLPDVRKTIDYYENMLRKKGDNPYSKGNILEMFKLLNKDIAYDGKTFRNPNVSLTRNIEIKWRWAK